MKKRERESVLGKIRKDTCEAISLWHVAVLMLAVLYFVPFGWSPFSFHFIHANVFHLIANMMATRAVVRYWDRLLAGYFVSSFLVVFSTTHVVGFSAVLFFIWGSHYLQQLKITPNKRQLVLNLAALFFISLLVPSVAFYMHSAPFACGILYTAGRNWIVRINKDIKEASF